MHAAAMDTDLVTIQGILTPCAWDEDCNATELVVHSRNEEDYFVADGPAGQSLRGCCPAVVSVTGRLIKDVGKKVLEVVSYRILDQH